MARSFWKLNAASDLITALYAMVESGYWSREELSAWSDRIIISVEVPQSWVIDISLNALKSQAALNETFKKVLQENGTILPDNFYEVCAGLVLLKYFDNLVTEDVARKLIADLSDPGGVAGIDIEGVGKADLNDPRFRKVRDIAESIVEYVNPRIIYSKHGSLVSV